MLLPVTIITGVLCTALAQEYKTVLGVSSHILDFRKYADICGKEHNVDPNDLRKLVTWPLDNDLAHKKFLYCVTLRGGYIQEDGHFNIDKALNLDYVNATREEFRGTLEKCNEITLENKYETVYEMGACLHRYHTIVIKKPK